MLRGAMRRSKPVRPYLVVGRLRRQRCKSPLAFLAIARVSTIGPTA